MKCHSRSLRWLLLAAAVLSIPLASASTPVDRTLAAEPNVHVSIEIVSGSLAIEAWQRPEIHIEGSLGEDVRGLEIDEGGGEVEIGLDLPRGRGSRDIAADLTIHLPAGASLEVQTVSADITVTAIAGEVEAESVSGDIAVVTPARSLKLSAVSGSVAIAGDAPVGRVEVEVVSGNVRLSAPPAQGARIDIEAVSGGVDLVVPADVSARFDLETFSGSIHNDFGYQASDSSSRRPPKEQEFTVGEGSARITVEVFSGEIRLIRVE